MNNDILLEIFFPAVYKSYDVYIPEDVTFFRINEMLRKVSGQLTDGLYVPCEESLLCDRETGTILDINQTARELCLHNGSKLMFI